MMIGLAFAGCVDSTDSSVPSEPQPSPAERAATAPATSWDVTESIDWWEHFATAFPKHDSNTPTNEEARNHIVAEMEAAGFNVEVRDYPATPRGQQPPAGEEELRYYAIVATKEGTEMPERRIGLVSHYDTQAATVHGAYDDSSGVAAEWTICKALADVPLRRTLSCIFFDAEEQGLQASEAYVADVTEGDEDFVYDLVLGYDMVGINWPGHEWKMYVMTGDEEKALYLAPWQRQLMHDVLGYPEAGVEVLEVHDRNSDEMNFKRAGIPIVRFAGGRDAIDYPGYHQPFDTVEFVYTYVDGRPNFEAGFSTIVDAGIATVQSFDATEPGELERVYN